MIIDYPSVPDNWTTEPVDGNRTIIMSPGGSCVTIDWRNRCFRAGMFTTYGAPASSGSYRGRGWSDRLVADAIKWIQENS